MKHCSEIVNNLNDVAREIKDRIQAYADLHNISFDEAKKRARLVLGNKEIRMDYEAQNGERNGSGES